MIDDPSSAPDEAREDEVVVLLSSFVTLLPMQAAAASTLGNAFDVETLAASNKWAARLDEAQIDHGEGPAWDAFRGRRAIESRRSGASAWPFFSSSHAAVDLASVVAIPLSLGPTAIGAVSLYSRDEVTLGAEELQLAESLAAVLGRSIVARALTEAETVDVVRDPSLSRREVHQATGMVISQTGSDAPDALLMIRAYAYSRTMTVRDVATEIVNRRLDFSTDRDITDRK